MVKKKIMIVEDEAITGIELKITLQNMGYNVCSIEKTGEQAVEKADRNRPDLILMDIRLKGKMDGIEAAEIIRSRFGISSVFLTAYADEKNFERAKPVMPLGYILKPFREKELKITLDMAFYTDGISKKRIKAEEELQKSSDTLEILVEERTAALISTNKLLEKEIKIRRQKEKELAHRYNEMDFLNKMLNNVTSSLSFSDVTASVIDGINDIIHPDLVIIFIKKGNSLIPIEQEPDVSKLLKDTDTHTAGECLCGLAVSRKKPQYSVDIHNDPRCVRTECKNAGYQSFAAFPLFSRKTIIGVLGLASFKERDFKNQAMFLELLSDQIAIGIQNSLLYKDVKKHEERFRIAAGAASDLIFERDIGTGRIKWFGDIDTMLGQGSRKKIKTFEDLCKLIHPDDRARIAQREQNEHNGQTVRPEIFRIRKKSGDYLYWENRCRTVFNNKGMPVKRIGVCTDITERKAAENDLKKSRYLLQTVFNSISDPLVLVSGDMKIMMMNKAALSYFKIELKDAVNAKCSELLKDPLSQCKGCRIASAVSENRTVSFERKACMNPKRDEHVTVYPVVESSAKNGGLVRIKDITEKKKTDAVLARTDRLTSLGQLSGGLAHEIRNPLGGIKLFLDILSDEERYERSKEEMEILNDINTNINKINGIIKRVLSFAKPDGNYPDNLNVNDVIKDSLKLIKNKLSKSNIIVKLYLADNLSFVKGDFIGLQQVITNLILNAVDAMENKGTLTIKTSSGESWFHNARTIKIAIKDTGSGINEEDQENIFNPFFTTKPAGTGLGLSISHKIVQRHGGILSFKSKPGMGTSFFIELPEVKGK